MREDEAEPHMDAAKGAGRRKRVCSENRRALYEEDGKWAGSDPMGQNQGRTGPGQSRGRRASVASGRREQAVA